MNFTKWTVFAAVFIFLTGAAPSAPVNPVGVDEFMKSARVGGGSAAIKGAVKAVYPAEKLFGLTDIEKSACCESSSNCVTGILPVKWAGDMPRAGSKVRVIGEVREEGGKLLFVAQTVRALD